jgi:hypothetical protein
LLIINRDKTVLVYSCKWRIFIFYEPDGVEEPHNI